MLVGLINKDDDLMGIDVQSVGLKVHVGQMVDGTTVALIENLSIVPYVDLGYMSSVSKTSFSISQVFHVQQYQYMSTCEHEE